ncbi:hypothetical protein [Okeania sp. KiyG1]
MTQNWRDRPLTNLQVVINLISNTTAAQGLNKYHRTKVFLRF